MRRRVVSHALFVVPMVLGLIVGVPAPGLADGDGAAPDAPTGLYVSESSVKDPNDYSLGYDLTLTWTQSVEHATPVTDYTLELSTDGGATWSPDPDAATTTDTHITVSRAPAGQAWLYRVFADSAAGQSPPTNPLTVATPDMDAGTDTQRFVIRTSTGAPLTNGAITWSDGYGTWSQAYHLNADGVVDLPDIPAGWGYLLRVDNAYLQSGIRIDKEWSVDVGTEPQTLVVPAPPAKEVRTIHVVMAGDVPVVGASIDLEYYEALVNVVNQDGFVYSDGQDTYDLTGDTDSTGTVVLSGWSAEGVHIIPPPEYPYPEQAALVIYNDGTLHQEEAALLDGPETTIELNPMPWLSTTQTDPTTRSTTTAFSFAAHPAPAGTGNRAAAAAQLAGIKVTLSPPAGWSATKCTKKPVLSGVTDKSGHVRLSACGAKSTVFTVHSSGAVPTGAVTLRVKHAPALSPARVSARSAAAGRLTATWSPPAYSGGTSVTAYRVTASSHGRKSVAKTVTRAAIRRSGRTVTFGGLKRAVPWTVTVRAITRYGVGSPCRAKVRTA